MELIQQLIHKIDEHDLWEDSITIKRNEFICKKGQKNTNLYLIQEGSVRIYITDQDKEHTIRFGYKNSFFGALDSFITDDKTDFNIQAIKKTSLKVISKNRYLDFIKESQENIELWNNLLSMLIFQQLEREKDLLTSSPKERYERVLKRSPLLFQEIPLKYIASYLRMSPETLSRLRKP